MEETVRCYNYIRKPKYININQGRGSPIAVYFYFLLINPLITSQYILTSIVNPHLFSSHIIHHLPIQKSDQYKISVVDAMLFVCNVWSAICLYGQQFKLCDSILYSVNLKKHNKIKSHPNDIDIENDRETDGGNARLWLWVWLLAYWEFEVYIYMSMSVSVLFYFYYYFFLIDLILKIKIYW